MYDELARAIESTERRVITTRRGHVLSIYVPLSLDRVLVTMRSAISTGSSMERGIAIWPQLPIGCAVSCPMPGTHKLAGYCPCKNFTRQEGNKYLDTSSVYLTVEVHRPPRLNTQVHLGLSYDSPQLGLCSISPETELRLVDIERGQLVTLFSGRSRQLISYDRVQGFFVGATVEFV